MKNLLFLISFLFACNSLHAQDIYTSGYYTNHDGSKTAAVLKNDVVIYSSIQDGKDMFSSAIAIDTANNDIYWSLNSNPTNSLSDGYGCVMKNGEILYSMENYAFNSVWVVPSPLSIEEIETSDNSIVFIYNIFGEIVKTINSDDDILTTDLPVGIYIAKRGKSVMKFVKCF